MKGADIVRMKEIKKLCDDAKIRWSTHCLERMQERDISRADVKNCLVNGEIIVRLPGFSAAIYRKRVQ